MAQGLEVRYVQFYTSGSAARQVVHPAAHRKETLPTPKKRKMIRICIDPVATLGIVIAVSMLICMVTGVCTLIRAQEQVHQAQAYVTQLTQDNLELQQEYENSYDLFDVEQTARVLGMIPKEEAPHVLVAVPQPQQAEQRNLWQQIGTFLTSLFA